MKLTILVVGKTKEAFWQAAEAEYIRRIEKFVSVRTVVIKPRSDEKGQSREAVMRQEGKDILSKIPEGDCMVALDGRGKQFSSEAFAHQLNEWQVGYGSISFIVGGTYGLAPEVIERADVVWSLSPLTFTHEEARVVMLEQIYRACTIVKNLPYHY